jgi:hypothetical protein
MVKAGYFAETGTSASRGSRPSVVGGYVIRAMWRVWRDYFVDAGRLSGLR